MAIAQRTNDEWLADLQMKGDRQALALEDLRQVVLRGLSYALAGKLPTDDAPFAALIEEVAQDECDDPSGTLSPAVFSYVKHRSAHSNAGEDLPRIEALPQLRMKMRVCGRKTDHENQKWLIATTGVRDFP